MMRPQYAANVGEQKAVHLHQSLQLVKLAVKILEVVSVQSSEAVVIHDLHQHAEGLLLWHLHSHTHTHNFRKAHPPMIGIYTGIKSTDKLLGE